MKHKSHAGHMKKVEMHKEKMAHHKEQMMHHKSLAKAAKSEYGSMDKKPLSDSKPTAKGGMKKW